MWKLDQIHHVISSGLAGTREGNHPLMWKLDQIHHAISSGLADTKELAAFACLEDVAYNHYRYSCINCTDFELLYKRWKRLDSWVGKEFMTQVKYWYDNDVEVSDEDAKWWITDTIEILLDNIGFDYDEPKKPAKRKRVTKPYKCSKCGQPKKGHACKVPEAKKAKVTEPEFAVPEAEFRQ